MPMPMVGGGVALTERVTGGAALAGGAAEGAPPKELFAPEKEEATGTPAVSPAVWWTSATSRRCFAYAQVTPACLRVFSPLD